MKGKAHAYQTNKRVRDALTEYGIPCWLLASKLNCHVNTLYRVLQTEQPVGKQDELIDAIKSIVKERQAEGDRVWADSTTYKRIIEILEDYWVTQPDEEYVEVRMHFKRANGDEQTKRLVWTNPLFEKSLSEEEMKEKILRDLRDGNVGLNLEKQFKKDMKAYQKEEEFWEGVKPEHD